MAGTDETEWPPHLDALVAAPANHRLLHEDEAVRVLEVSVEPGERENLHHHRWPSIMVVLARPGYVNRDAQGNVIPPAGGMPADPVLPRAVPLPPQATHAIEVDADAPFPWHPDRVQDAEGLRSGLSRQPASDQPALRASSVPGPRRAGTR